MSGYAASARLQGGSMRFVAAAPAPTAEPGRPATTPGAWLDRRPVALTGRPPGDRLAEWLDDVRATWSQTTFFLCHPESWR